MIADHSGRLPLFAAALLAVLVAAGGRGGAVSATVSAGLLAIAAGLIWRWRHLLSADRVVLAMVLVYCVGFFAVPAAVGVVDSAGSLLDLLASQRPDDTWVDFGSLVLVLSALYVAVRRWPSSLGERGFLIAGTMITMVLRIYYVHLVHMTPYSDFGSMWNLVDSVAEGRTAVETTGLRPVGAIHMERVIPYLLPLRWLFGPESSSYAIPNALLATISPLLVYWLGRRWFGLLAARFAFVAAHLAPEPWLAAEIPTHDLPAAFFTLVSLCLFVLLAESAVAGRKRAWVLAAAFALSLLVVELQRSTGLVVLVACGCVGALALWSRWRRGDLPVPRATLALLWLVLLPSALFVLGERYLVVRGLAASPQQMRTHGRVAMAAHTDVSGYGTYRHYFDVWLRYQDAEVEWDELIARKWLTETHRDFDGRLTHYLGKVRRLFALGDQFPFYTRGASIGSSEREMDERDLGRLSLATDVWVILLLSLSIAGVLGLWRRRAPLLALLPVFYLATLAGGLLLLAEVQPRFMFQIWHLSPIYFGSQLARVTRPREKSDA